VPARSLSARSECWQAEGRAGALLRGQLPRALAAARRSVDALERRGMTRDPIYMAALNQVALAHAGVGDFRASYRTTLKAREALRAVGLQGTQQDLIIAMQEIDMLAQGGKPLEALRLLTELRADSHVAVEHQVPAFAIEQRLGLVSMKLDRAGEALAAFDACAEGARAAGNRLFEQGYSWRALEALVAEGRLAEARDRARFAVVGSGGNRERHPHGRQAARGPRAHRVADRPSRRGARRCGARRSDPQRARPARFASARRPDARGALRGCARRVGERSRTRARRRSSARATRRSSRRRRPRSARCC
jgi:hypothetical protein